MYFPEILILPFLLLVHMGLGDDPHDVTRAKCRDESGLTEDEAAGGFTDVQPKLGCYVKCLMLDVGVMDEDGVMSPEKLTIEIGRDLKDEAEPTIFDCFEETKEIADACEKMTQFFQCFKERNPMTFAKLGVFGKPGPNRQY